jgi:nucleotide-binding universal stress UspA family protein
MREVHVVSPAVVVGIDGSRSAVSAALWAVDEAVSRDIPLRLTYVIAPRGPGPLFGPQDAARDLATAEIAVRTAFCAVESLERPVKVEVEILQDHPTPALMNASRSAEMLCVGAIGLNQATGRQVGSTAAALSVSAHCPLAIVRNHQPTPAVGWVVSELDGSADSLPVLQLAAEEARLRGAPLRVLTSRQSCPGERRDGDHTIAENDRQACAQLERRVARWRRMYPEMDIETAAVHGTTIDYLRRHASSIQLAVVGQHRARGLTDFVGPVAHAAFDHSNCSVLICGRHRAL